MNDPANRRRLVRLPEHGKLGGVCAGMAEYLDADVALVRLAWVILAIVPGGIIGGVVAYVAAMLIMPVASASSAPRARVMRSRADRKIAGVCGGLAEYLDVDSTVVRLAWAVLTIMPGAIVLGVVAYLVAWFIVPERPAVLAAATPATGTTI